MKKVLIVLLAIAMLTMAGIALAGITNPGINGTPHNIPGVASKTNTAVGAEPCAFCHTPHVPVSGEPTYPLWNRSQLTQTYTMYTSRTFQMSSTSATKVDTAVDSSTRACMQCHNGQVSTLLNYPGRGTNSTTPDKTKYDFVVSDAAFAYLGNLGTDLRQEHPVAFTYVASVDTDENNFPTPVSNKVASRFPLFSTGSALGDMMGCGTCHEPHDRYVYTGKGSTQVYFLRNATGANGNADSAMCRACHVNKW